MVQYMNAFVPALDAAISPTEIHNWVSQSD